MYHCTTSYDGLYTESPPSSLVPDTSHLAAMGTNKLYLWIKGCVRRIGRVDAFRPKGHGCNSLSSRHVRTLTNSFTHSCLWCFGVKFRHSIRAVSGAPLSSSGLEEAL